MSAPVPIPGWLRRPEAYRPAPGRDPFLDRSLAALLGLLAQLRALAGPASGGWAGPASGGRPGTDPGVKAAAGLVAVLAVGLTRSPGVLALAGTGLLVILALQEARVIARALRAGLAAGALAAVMLAPAAFLGPVPAAGRLLAKVLLTTVTVRLVAANTGWPALASVLRRLGLPDAFLLVLDLALKYLALLGAFALALLEALRLRAVGRQRRGTAALGAVAGTLFLKSLDQAAALHDAMRCRGFTGRYRPAARLRLGVRELALGGAAGVLAAASILGRT